MRKGWRPRTVGASQGNLNAAKDPAGATTLVATGILVTWNQPVPANKSLRMLLQQVRTAEPGSPKYEKLMEKVLEHPTLQRKWAAFHQFVLENLPHAGNITEVSAYLEFVLKCEESRCHLHAMVSNQHPDVGNDSKLVTLHMHRLDSRSICPHGSCARGRGRQAIISLARMHAYCQWPKVGSVWQKSNFRRGIDLGCRASLVFDAWQHARCRWQRPAERSSTAVTELMLRCVSCVRTRRWCNQS